MFVDSRKESAYCDECNQLGLNYPIIWAWSHHDSVELAHFETTSHLVIAAHAGVCIAFDLAVVNGDSLLF